jgi:HSP20 family protein
MSTTPARLDPWEQVSRLQRVMDDMFGRITDNRGRAQFAWTPSVDVSRTGDCLVFKFDLPGMNADDVNIEIRDRMLVVSGERSEERERPSGQEGYLTRERAFGAFSRSFALPQAIDEEQISARFSNGVLEIKAPLGSGGGPRRIPIEGQGERTSDASMAASHAASSPQVPSEGETGEPRSPLPPADQEQSGI